MFEEYPFRVVWGSFCEQRPQGRSFVMLQSSTVLLLRLSSLKVYQSVLLWSSKYCRSLKHWQVRSLLSETLQKCLFVQEFPPQQPNLICLSIEIGKVGSDSPAHRLLVKLERRLAQLLTNYRIVECSWIVSQMNLVRFRSHWLTLVWRG